MHLNLLKEWLEKAFAQPKKLDFLDFYNKQSSPLFDGKGNVIGYKDGTKGTTEKFDKPIPKEEYKGPDPRAINTRSPIQRKPDPRAINTKRPVPSSEDVNPRGDRKPFERHGRPAGGNSNRDAAYPSG